MFGALTFLVVVLVASAAAAEDGTANHVRLRLRTSELTELGPPRAVPPAADPLSRLIDHFKNDALGTRALVALVPSDAEDAHAARLPTVALFAHIYDRTILSLTQVQARADSGQDIVMQRTVVSDLLAGRRFSLTVYEDHVLADTATLLMGMGAKLTLRPTFDVAGWRLRLEAMGSYDFTAGATVYLAISGVPQVPPVPVGVTVPLGLAPPP